MAIDLPSALVGQLVLFGVFALVVYALVREAARLVIKVLVVAAIVVAIALFAGWLDQTMVGRLLEQVGDALIVGIKAVVRWIMKAWSAISGSSSATPYRSIT